MEQCRVKQCRVKECDENQNVLLFCNVDKRNSDKQTIMTSDDAFFELELIIRETSISHILSEEIYVYFIIIIMIIHKREDYV